MELFIHIKGRPLDIVDLDEETTIADLCARYGDEESQAWLEGADKPLDAKKTLSTAKVAEHAHIQISRCRTAIVAVRYGGDAKEEEFAPGATIAAVYAWAVGKKGFDLPQAERAKHGLAASGTNTQLDKAEHVGNFAGGDCRVTLDLAPIERFAG